jgi:excisionase family DNA binding protein
MGEPLTPDQAAERAGTSRRSIARAIAAHELRAVRDNRNRWRIDAEDLAAWHAQRAPSARAQVDAQAIETELRAAQAEAAGLREVAAELRAELAGRDALLAEIRADRDRWHQQAVQPRGLGAWLAALLGHR